MKKGLTHLRTSHLLFFIGLIALESIFFYFVIFMNSNLPNYLAFIAIGVAGIFMNLPIVLYVYTKSKNRFIDEVTTAESNEKISFDQEYSDSTKLCKNIYITSLYLFHKSFLDFYVTNLNQIETVTVERNKSGRGARYFLKLTTNNENPISIGYRNKKTALNCLAILQDCLEEKKVVTVM